jgi:MerR family transcriptional regulator, light-induced transcriptional regulator
VNPGLNIAALTWRTGVPSDTIRKWEQRYGVLHPERTSGGQRRYSDLDVARVEWLKARLGEGYRIGEAAALLGPGETVALSTQELHAEIVDATARNDMPALSRHVGQAIALPSLAEAFLEVLAPALIEIGERWEAGELTVAQEHLASGAVRSALQKLLADARAEVRGVAVLACVPEERHEIGLLMLAVLLRADGWQVAYLGADTPVLDAVELAADLGASVACFSSTTKERSDALHDELAHLHVPPRLEVIVGGRACDDVDVRRTVASLRRRSA